MNLNQVTLPSTDVGRAVEFYRQLGFIQVVDNLPTYARFECPEGGATFSIHRVLNVVHDSGVVVYFECSDLDALVARLQARRVAFDSQPKDQPWLWREAYLHDPDGNVICLYHAGENRRNLPWRLPSQQ